MALVVQVARVARADSAVVEAVVAVVEAEAAVVVEAAVEVADVRAPTLGASTT